MLAAATRTRLFRSPLLRPLTDEVAINDVLSTVHPLWSVSEVRARIVQRIAETPDTTTFVLQANRLWPDHRAGQHVAITVEVDGVRHHRTFSLSSRPGAAPTLTVKRNGPVSTWLNASAPLGTVLTLSTPRGEFVLPEALPSKLLMIGAGSGVTPVMSMLRDLDARGFAGDLTFVHVSRNATDAIFQAELRAIAARRGNLRLIEIRTDVDGLPTPAALSRLVPDFTQRESYLCGPPAFMSMVEGLFAEHQASAKLHLERFGAPPAKTGGATAQISCTRSARSFSADTGAALLSQAEGAGLKPKFGCRMGICMTCKCKKASGTVQNLLTGEISSEPGEMIQLCISAARSDLQLDL